ncbi:hypothetical protein GCM10023318_05790 [Nocardia callitridis]|uniref:Uncharacterized protein n=1 Tax=Nocardia callitridis TaxID=648753 RepID=A0ABP9JTN8_9NOCA
MRDERGIDGCQALVDGLGGRNGADSGGEDQRPRIVAPHLIAGAQHARTAGTERIRDEPRGRRTGTVVIAARHLRSGDIQLTGVPVGHRRQPPIQHAFGDPAQRGAESHRRGCLVLPHRDMRGHGGLGAAVYEAQFAESTPGYRARPALRELRRAGERIENHHAQLVEFLGVELRRRRVRQVGMRHRFPAQQCGQRLGLRVRHDQQTRRTTQRKQRFQHRGVGALRGEMQHSRPGMHPVPHALLVAEAREPGLGHHDATRRS